MDRLRQTPSVDRRSGAAGRRITFEGWVWLALALGLWACGMYKGINLVTLLAYFMLVLWWFNSYLAKRQVRRLQVRRWQGGPVFAGSTCQVDVELHDPEGRPRFRLRLKDTGEAHDASWFMSEASAGAPQRFRQEIQLSKRGWYHWQPLRASSSYPFGLLERFVTDERAAPLMVYPALGKLHRGRLRRFLQTSSAFSRQVRSLSRRHHSAQFEFHGLREFRTGDSPRLIHWRTSARRGCLMVREFEEMPAENLIVILDPWQPADNVGCEAVEQAVSLAATIGWEWCQRPGDRLALAIAGRDNPVIQHGPTSVTMGHLLLEATALASGVSDINLDRLAARIAALDFPRAPVLFVTTRTEDVRPLLSQRIYRDVIAVQVSELDRYDFYETPTAPGC